MSTFDSPVARCEAVREMVVTDQTQAECAHEHDCPPGSVCPLCGWFAEADMPAEDVEVPSPDPAGKA